MGGGPVIRTMAAAMTVGASELGQKKPFQNMTDKDEPTGSVTGGPLRFLPGAAGIAPALDAMTPKMPELPSPASPTEPLTNAISEKTTKRTKRNFSTVLTDPLSLGTPTTSIGRSTLLGSGFNKSSFGR